MVAIGNTRLVQYGVMEDDSDYRIHVCKKVKRAYCYPTKETKALLSDLSFQERSVTTSGITTATGWLMPIHIVPDCQHIIIPEETLERWPILEEDTTTIKGQKAVFIAKDLLARGLIKIRLDAIEVADLDLQIKGQDIIANSKITFQVKCDLKGGCKKSGGTGNLFMQKSECNPFKAH